MKPKYIQTYMDIAERWAQESSAIKLKVGAVIVSGDAMVVGYNGTPEGWDNECEYKVWMPADALDTYTADEIEKIWPYVERSSETFAGELESPVIGRYYLKTKDEVLHAERNALDKIAKNHSIGANNAILFVTHAPCLECAKSIYSSGIKEVYYKNNYKSTKGIEFLEKTGIKIIKVP